MSSIILGLNQQEFRDCTKIIHELYEEVILNSDEVEKDAETFTLFKKINERLVQIARIPVIFIFREDKRLQLMDLIFQDSVFADFFLMNAGMFFARVSSDNQFLLRLSYNLSQAIYMKESIYQLIPDINKSSMVQDAKEIDAMFSLLQNENSDKIISNSSATATEKLCYILESNRLLLYCVLVIISLNIYFIEKK